MRISRINDLVIDHVVGQCFRTVLDTVQELSCAYQRRAEPPFVRVDHVRLKRRVAVLFAKPVEQLHDRCFDSVT